MENPGIYYTQYDGKFPLITTVIKEKKILNYHEIKIYAFAGVFLSTMLVSPLKDVHADKIPEKKSLLLEIPAILVASSNTTSFGAPGEPNPQSVEYMGLEWEENAYSNPRSWEEAVTYCNNLKLSGHYDWRLPTKDELKSLVTCSNGKATPLADWKVVYPENDLENYQLATCCTNFPKCDNFVRPTINTQFPCSSHPYWSSTTDEKGNIWGVNFYDGRAISGYYPDLSNETRCVRTIIDQ